MKFDIKSLIEDFKEKKVVLQVIYSEKGFEPFKKPLIISVLILLVLYYIYNSFSSNLKFATMEYEKLKTIASYYSQYKEYKTKFEYYTTKLPPVNKKADFLDNVLNEVSKKYKIVFNVIGTQKEVKVENYYIVSKYVEFTTNYFNLGKFIAELENNPYFIQLTEVKISKKENDLEGNVNVGMSVTTVFAEFNI